MGASRLLHNVNFSQFTTSSFTRHPPPALMLYTSAIAAVLFQPEPATPEGTCGEPGFLGGCCCLRPPSHTFSAAFPSPVAPCSCFVVAALVADAVAFLAQHNLAARLHKLDVAALGTGVLTYLALTVAKLSHSKSAKVRRATMFVLVGGLCSPFRLVCAVQFAGLAALYEWLSAFAKAGSYYTTHRWDHVAAVQQRCVCARAPRDILLVVTLCAVCLCARVDVNARAWMLRVPVPCLQAWMVRRVMSWQQRLRTTRQEPTARQGTHQKAPPQTTARPLWRKTTSCYGGIFATR